MAVAALHNKDRKKLTIVLTVAILVTGLLVGFLILSLNNLNKRQTIVNQAAAPTNSCPTNGAICSWRYSQAGVSFEYSITDITTGAIVKSGTTTDKQVVFTPIVDHAFRCRVAVINSCGKGIPKDVTNTCTGVLQPTPTPSPTPTKPLLPTPTPTLPPGVTPSPTKTPTPTPTLPPGVTPTITATPTPTIRPTNTPTPTEVSIVVTTPTPTPTGIFVAQSTPVPTTPPPPVSGNQWQSIAIVIASILVISLGLLL